MNCIIDSFWNGFVDLAKVIFQIQFGLRVIVVHLISQLRDRLLHLFLELGVAAHYVLLEGLNSLLILPFDSIQSLPHVLSLVLLRLEQLLVQEVVQVVELLLDHLV